ncbi:MAG: hypothetical protein KDJ28_14090 [Candidatus Competibacteraceae bacterium]|nr:hypothetical protein [Candidatus Competibacteraceae bacterium]
MRELIFSEGEAMELPVIPLTRLTFAPYALENRQTGTASTGQSGVLQGLIK